MQHQIHSPTLSTKPRVNAEPPSRVDVAIIGCGTGGLMAGAELAQAGLSVALFDPHYVAGGCGTQFARGGARQRYNFDVGLHYLGDCGSDGIIPRLLAGVGVDVDFVPMDQDGFDTLIFPDFRFRVPASLELYRERLLDHFPTEKRGIDRYVRIVDEVMRIGQQIEANGGKLSPRTVLDVITSGRLLLRYQFATAAKFLDGCTRNPQLRAVMMGQNGDYALPPSEVSVMLHAGLAAHYFKGAYYPRGGGQTISDRLADRIERAGGTVHLRRGIAQVMIERGRAVGVRTEPRSGNSGDSCEVRADVVISNADLKRTLLELVPPNALPSQWKQRAERFEMAGALFMTFLGVKGDMRELGMGASNYWQFDDYDFERAYREARRSPTIEPTGCYITSASLKDPDTAGHAPEGVTNVEIMALVDGNFRKWGVKADPKGIDRWSYKKSPAYVDVKRRVEDNLIARMDALFPGSGERIVFRESATPVSHTRYTRASGGTGYGIACTPDQFLGKRPGYEGPLPGLYFCGASTRAGHGIVGAMLSGHHCAKLVKKKLGRRVSS